MAMSFPPGQAGGAPPGAPPGVAGAEVPPQVLVQILATEHWSLLASRNLAWNETFTRTGMFLSTLSFSLVALALVGQATAFDSGFRMFALVVLPLVLLVGVATSLRIDNANYHELVCVVGMNRIRAHYVEIAPRAAEAFVMGTTDDEQGVELTVANVPGRGLFANLIAATPAMLAVLNSALLAAIVALLLIQLGIEGAPAVGAGVVVFVVAFALNALIWRRQLNQILAGHTPKYPTREDSGAGERGASRPGSRRSGA
jgi:hypothetical protein